MPTLPRPAPVMAVMRRSAVVAAAVTAILVLSCAALAGAAGLTADPAPIEVTGEPLDLPADPLTDRTGLAVTIDTISPAALEPGRALRLSGEVSNVGDDNWRDAQVYLDVASDPVTTKGGLEEINGSTEPFGTRIVEIGLFDEIGAVPPGTTKPYQLKIPYSAIPVNGAPGVYRVGASVLAANREGRDLDADARVDTVISLVSGLDSAPTEVVTAVPVTAPVIRHPSGSFLDESLAGEISSGGRLRNLVDFLDVLPVDTVEIVADPALLDAVADMSDGYSVTTRQQESDETPGRTGTGQVAAQEWLADFETVISSQDLLLMAWGSPDASALALQQMPGVVAEAVQSSDGYAADRGLITPTVNWQRDGASTRRGLVVAREAGAVIQFVSASSLVNLRAAGDSAYLPSLVRVPTAAGELTVVVTAGELAGERLTRGTSVLDFRQDLMAEATIRSLEAAPGLSPAVVALPFGWDPGGDADDVDLAVAYDLATVQPVDLEVATRSTPAAYPGPIVPPPGQSMLSEELTTAIARLRTNGNTLSSLLTDNTDAVSFEQRLALSASSLWVSQPQERLALIRMESRAIEEQLRRVTVTGPTFVALSSKSGRFPLTITNGLTESVTLRVNVRAKNPALRIDPIEELVLEPGQSRDIEVTTRSDSSGLTPVRVRLSTVDGRTFSAPWEFDVRATQIGVAIWVVMAVGGAILVGTVAFRLVRRIRTHGLHPREKPSP